MLVNLHVGKDITAKTQFTQWNGTAWADMDYSMNQMGWYFQNQPTVYVRFNSTWYGVDITDTIAEAKANNAPLNTWVYCSVPLSAVKNNDWNYINLSSNIVNGGNGVIDSMNVTVQFSAAGDGQTYGTNDQNCNGGWYGYGTTVNTYLELYDGEKWVELDGGANYDTTGGSLVIGKFTPDGYTYLPGRNLEAPELTGYTKARLLVNAHVGGNLPLE